MVDFEGAAKKLSTVNETGLSQVSKLAQMQLQVEQRDKELLDERRRKDDSERSTSELWHSKKYK